MQRIPILSLALLLCLVAVAPRASVSARKQRLDPRPCMPGEVIVKLRRNALALSPPDRAERLTRVRNLASDNNRPVSDRSVESLVSDFTSDRVSKIISGRGLDRVFVLKFDPNADLDSIIDELRSRDDVEYAEPNYRIKLGTVPANDPDFSSQWSLMNLGLGIDIVVDATGRIERFPATLNADIKADAAWEITTGSPNVIVAVSDTGVDLTHPDLQRNIYTNPAEIPDNGIDDDKNGFVDDVHGYNVADHNPDVGDVVGHGTQMAGLIAAEINNNIGIAGVSQSQILPVRFYRKTGPDPEDYDASVADAARSLVYSIAAGASIINASWRTFLSPDDVPEEVASALQDAVSATNDAGILLVCIAGNEGFDNDVSKIYPTAYQMPNQITVAASDYNDEMWHPPFNPFHINSGFGKHTVDLAAPGVSVLSTAARGDCVLCSNSQKPEDWYARGDGTSVSAALVSGVAALVKSMHPNDNAILLKRRILAGVDVLDSLQPYVITGGRLNAAGALSASISISQPVLVSVKYKGGGEKLFVWVTDTEKGFKVVVGKTAYSAKPKGDRFLARVPKSAFPSGVGVDIKLRNPDGGESQPITFTR
jgi:subtilisin family serine protease